MTSGVRSGNFRGVKITLIIFQTLALIGSIILLILSIAVISVLGKTESDDQENAKIIVIVVIVVAVLSIIIEIIGLVGAIKENQTLTIIFGVAMALSTIANFATVRIWSAILNLIVRILAFVFVHLIRKEVGPTGNYV